jgi:hypothetical protein
MSTVEPPPDAERPQRPPSPPGPGPEHHHRGWMWLSIALDQATSEKIQNITADCKASLGGA